MKHDNAARKKNVDIDIMVFSMMSLCLISLGMALYKCFYRENGWRFNEFSFGDAVGAFCLSLGFLFFSYLFWGVLGLAILKYIRGYKEIDMPVAYSELDDARQSPQHWSVGAFVCGFGAAMLYLVIINY
jgi:hypothetical protein